VAGWSDRRAAARRGAAVLLAGLSLAGWAGLTAAAALAQSPPPAPAPPEQIPAPPSEPPPAPAPPPARMHARVVRTEIAGDEVTRHEFNFYKLGNKVRLVPPEPGDLRFTPETLYDYDRRVFYRNLSEDVITFVYHLSTKERVLAQIEGFMTTPADEPVYRLEVNPNLTFDGHPCTLVLAGFPAPDGRIHALRWVWEARDLDGQPVKVVFPRGDGSIDIVEFLDATGAPFDPALVSVPEGRPVMDGL
jgi:hypothetical protein